MMKHDEILVTGGSGLLGGELKRLMPKAVFPDHNEFDVTDYEQMYAYIKEKSFSHILHAAAFTSPPRIDKDPVKALEVNIIGTANIVKLCNKRGIKLIYISTDYIFDGNKGRYKESDPVFPVNKYAWSKLGGECAVRLYDNSLIIRTSFSENEFPYDKAFTDQWTSRLSVREFAEKLIEAIEKNISGTLHIGGPRQTVFDYAKRLSPSKNIGELTRDDVSFSVPEDTSLDISRFNDVVKK